MDPAKPSPRFTLHHVRSLPRVPHAPDNPESLARRAIGLLEDHLRERYGLLVPMGVELEFVSQYPVRFKDDKGWENPNGAPVDPLGYPDAGRRDHLAQRFEPAYRKACPTVRLFRNSPSLAYLYREEEYLTDHGLNQYEMVFTHRGAYGPPEAHRLANLAAGVALKRQQFTGERPRCPTAARLMKPEPLNHPFPEGYFPEASFTPYVSGIKVDRPSAVKNGMHINFSTLDRTSGEAITRVEDNDMNSALDGRIADAHWALINEVLWLIAPTPDNYRRLEYKNARNPSFTDGTRIYFENPIAAANSNPYYATLTNLAAIALACAGKTPQEVRAIADQPYALVHERPAPATSVLPLRLAEAKSRFTQETLLRNLLNDLEPQLGNRFHAAILRTPPGKEPGAYPSPQATR